jgi:DDE family transposase
MNHFLPAAPALTRPGGKDPNSMRSAGNLSTWLGDLLPDAGRCAQHAAAALLRSMLAGFTAQLAQLARQAALDADRAKGRYQYFSRWLNRPHWAPDTLYAGLNRQARRWLLARRQLPLLLDLTELADSWTVLQISFPWERRALPLYRAVVQHTAPELHRRELVRAALAFLRAELPGPRSRYVLVADRGFPGHWLIRALQEGDWRFVLRVTRRWKVCHSAFTGELAEAPGVAGLVGPRPRRLAGAQFGRRGKGANEWSEADLVLYHGAGREERWYLVTGEPTAASAVALYRQRMQIECEFRDVKGPFGLDQLARWQQRERVARFLAVVAAYEWRLAILWIRHQLRRLRAAFTKYGRLSWIRLTREWIQLKLRTAAHPALARL